MAISFQSVTRAAGQEAGALAETFGLSADQLETAPQLSDAPTGQNETFFIPCREHVVIKGDTILSIWNKTCPPGSKKTFGSMAFLAAVKQLNPEYSDPSFNLIKPGDTLKIPAFDYAPDGTTAPLNQSIVAQGDKKISELREALGVTAELDSTSYDALFDDTDVLAHYQETYDDSAAPVNDLSAKVFYIETLADWAAAEGLDPSDVEGSIELFQTRYLQMDPETGMNEYGSNDLPGFIGEDTLTTLDEFYGACLEDEESLVETEEEAPPTSQPAPLPAENQGKKSSPDVGSTSATAVSGVNTAPKNPVPGETPPWADDFYIVDHVTELFIFNAVVSHTSVRGRDTAHWITLEPPELQTEYDELTTRFATIADENTYDVESHPDYLSLKQDWQRFAYHNDSALRKFEITKAKEAKVHSALFNKNQGNDSAIAAEFYSVAQETVMSTKLPTKVVNEYRETYTANVDEVRNSDLWQVYYQPLLDQYSEFVDNSSFTKDIFISNEQLETTYDFDRILHGFVEAKKIS